MLEPNNKDINPNNKDINIDEKRDGFLTQASKSAIFYQNLTIHPLYDDRKFDSATNLYQQVKVHDVPLNRTTKYLDALCYPLEYPYGTICQNAETSNSTSRL